MGKLSDVVYLDATAQADLIRKKEVKPLELVEAAIERVEAFNPTINAVITPMYAYARKAALRTSLGGTFCRRPFPAQGCPGRICRGTLDRRLEFSA